MSKMSEERIREHRATKIADELRKELATLTRAEARKRLESEVGFDVSEAMFDNIIVLESLHFASEGEWTDRTRTVAFHLVELMKRLGEPIPDPLRRVSSGKSVTTNEDVVPLSASKAKMRRVKGRGQNTDRGDLAARITKFGKSLVVGEWTAFPMEPGDDVAAAAKACSAMLGRMYGGRQGFATSLYHIPGQIACLRKR